jgi:hypothetical protein
MQTEEGDVDEEEEEAEKGQVSWAYIPGVLWLELLGERTRLLTRTLTSRLPNEIMGFREGKSRKRTSGNNHWAALSAKGWMDGSFPACVAMLLASACAQLLAGAFAYLFGFSLLSHCRQEFILCLFFSPLHRIDFLSIAEKIT